MKTKLEMDDIRVGMFVTILRGRENGYRPIPNEDGSFTQVISYDDRYNGKVLEVKAVNYPYIAVNHYWAKSKKDIEYKVFNLDLREIILEKIGKEYIKALCPGLKVKEDDPDCSSHIVDEILAGKIK